MRRLSLIVLLIFTVNAARSQHKGKAYAAFKSGKYEKALAAFTVMVSDYESHFGNEDTAHYGYALYHLALCYHETDQQQKAKAFFLHCLDVYKSDSLNPVFRQCLINIAKIYNEKGNYRAAQYFYLRASKIMKISGNDAGNEAYNLMNELGEAQYYLGNYDDALQSFLQALELSEKLMGAKSQDYASCLGNVGLVYGSMGDFSKAEEYFLRVIEMGNKILSKKDPVRAVNINNLAMVYDLSGQYKKAEKLYLEALEFFEKAGLEKEEDYISCLNNLGLLYRTMGQYTAAEQYLLKALDLRTQLIGVEHPDYATSLNNLAIFYEEMGDFVKAENFLMQALEIDKKMLGEQSPAYAFDLNNIAYFYCEMGEYERAEPYYRQALHIYENVQGEQHPEQANCLGNLARLYFHLGDNALAESLYLEAINMAKESFGEDHANLAILYNNLALLYKYIGDFSQAEQFYLRALDIQKKAVGEKHQQYVASLNNLAGLYLATGNTAKAESLFLEASNAYKEIYGTQHPAFAGSLNNLAVVYERNGEWDKAREFYLEAMTIRKEMLGEFHPDYAESLDHVAVLYMNQQEYDKAKPLLMQEAEIVAKTLGEKHTQYASVLSNEGLCFYAGGEIDEADSCFRMAADIRLENIHQNFGFLSEKGKEQYLATVSSDFEIYQSFALKEKCNLPQLTAQAYRLSVALKGMVLNSGIHMRQEILQSGDSAIIRDYEQWSSLKATLAAQETKTIDKRISNLDSLTELAEQVEKKMSRKSYRFDQNRDLGAINFNMVQQQLRSGEIAIEFTSFVFHNGIAWTDSVMYAALILMPGDQLPLMVPLFEQNQLDSLIHNAETSNEIFADRLYRGITLPTAASQQIDGSKLYELVWEPLSAFIPEGSTVYFSPTGTLQQIAFAAIRLKDGSCLADHYTLHQLNSTGTLAGINQQKDVDFNSIMLFGGIYYDAKPDTSYSSTAHFGSHLLNRSSTLDWSKAFGKWEYLPGTENEIMDIQALAERYKIPCSLYSGSNAREEVIKSIEPEKAPSIIHIATHGFFIPDPDQKNDAKKRHTQASLYERDNPLKRAGLIFASANNNLEMNQIGVEDGILTANESSYLKLYNTELVVLSACETGLGEIRGSEGVFGLQRAFKAAGVRYLIMSLWKVPDVETAEFMDLFYESLFGGSEIRNSFHNAQQKMREKYPDEPSKWAAFLLIE